MTKKKQSDRLTKQDAALNNGARSAQAAIDVFEDALHDREARLTRRREDQSAGLADRFPALDGRKG